MFALVKSHRLYKGAGFTQAATQSISFAFSQTSRLFITRNLRTTTYRAPGASGTQPEIKMYIPCTCVLLLYDGNYDSVCSWREMDGERVPVNFRERVCEQFVSVNFQIASRSGRSLEAVFMGVSNFGCWKFGVYGFFFKEDYRSRCLIMCLVMIS